MNIKYILTVFLAIGAALDGCSAANSPSEADLARAVNEGMARPEMCPFTGFSGADTPAFSTEGFPVWASSTGPAPILDALVAHGFATKVQAQPPAGSYAAWAGKTSGFQFALTPKGKRDVVMVASPWSKGVKDGICVGKHLVQKILGFTVPASNRGVIQTTVEYTYTTEDVPLWAHDPSAKAASAILQEVTRPQTPIEGKARLVLTNHGWKAIAINGYQISD